MQGKVSMVMPCYNKVTYIHEMFDSILAQEWDNIELILVNDGSTDGTREVIAAYEPKFLARGFEVIIVDQQNAGVCAATKAGLERMSGDYVCVADSDDELDPKYVSTMAGWLEGHSEYDIAACGFTYYVHQDGRKVFSQTWLPSIQDGVLRVEDYLNQILFPAPWGYLLRREYFDSCHITDSYYTNTKGSHEPGFMIPMTAMGGRMYGVKLPLYLHNRSDIHSHSQHQEFEALRNHHEEYHRLCVIAINSLPDAVADKAKKQDLCVFSEIMFHVRVYHQAGSAVGGKIGANAAYANLINIVNRELSLSPPVRPEQILGLEDVLVWAARRLFTGLLQQSDRKIPKGRIIGYGAMGKAAARLLPLLKGTKLEPHELWDMAGDGERIKLPNWESLCTDDLLLVFPVNVVEDSLRCRFKNEEFSVFYNKEIWDCLALELLHMGS